MRSVKKKKKVGKKTSWLVSLRNGWHGLKEFASVIRFRGIRRHLVQKMMIFSAVLLVGLGTAVWWSGYPQIWFAKAEESLLMNSAQWGLKIEEVMVTGRTYASVEKILAAVQLKRGDPIMARSVAEIQNSLEEVSWIKKAQVQRRLPNILYIAIEERQPIAIWQHQKVNYLVDTEGVVVSHDSVAQFKHLPVVVGGDAPLHVPQILRILDRFPEIRKQVTALVRVGGRRWNLQLRNALEVKLPELKPEEALARLNLLLQQNKIDPSEMATIDLRVGNQMIMRLSPAAAIRLKDEGNET
jgi:cell division protein FtsQ